MKILLISNGFPPDQWAGTETYTASLAQELDKRGYQVQVLCAGDWDTGSNHWNGYSDSTHFGIPIRRVHLNWAAAPDPFLYLYNNPVVAAYLRQFLDEFQPDLVHVTSCERLSASVLGVVKETGLPLVLSLTDFWFLCPRINLLRSDGHNCSGQTSAWDCLRCQLFHAKAYRWPSQVLPESGVSRLLTSISQYPQLTRHRGLRGLAGDMADRKQFLSEALQWPDYRITASRFVHDLFVASGVTTPIKVQPYGHDLGWLKAYRGKSASEVVRIGFIGQISNSKGVHLLLQAAKLLQESGQDQFKLLIYGNVDKFFEYGSRLRALAAYLPQVQFCGTYPHEESAAVFEQLDVLVVPSVWYDFPLIIYEAFATKTPVIASNLGGMAEAVTHNVNGLLFERGNVTDLAAQLQRLLVEPRLLNQLQAGIPQVKTIEEEIDEFESIYTQVAKVVV